MYFSEAEYSVIFFFSHTIWFFFHHFFFALLPLWSFVFVLLLCSSPCSDWQWFEVLRNIKICGLSSSFISSRGDNIHCWSTVCSVLLLFLFTRTHLYLHTIVFPQNLREVGLSADESLWGGRFHFTPIFLDMLLQLIYWCLMGWSGVEYMVSRWQSLGFPDLLQATWTAICQK